MIRERTIRFTNQRVAEARRSGVTVPAAATTKLARSMLSRHLEDAATVVHGAAATAWELTDQAISQLVERFLHTQSETIVGGTSDIQRGIIGDRALNLPRKPHIERDVPWSRTRH